MDDKVRVLLVDDEVDILDVTKVELENAGYFVIEARNGQQCLDLARSENPDIIVLDIALPDINGFEIIRQTTIDEKICNIPIILYTCHAEMHALLKIQKGLPLLQPLVFKTADTQELIDEIERVLSERAPSQDS